MLLSCVLVGNFAITPSGYSLPSNSPTMGVEHITTEGKATESTEILDSPILIKLIEGGGYIAFLLTLSLFFKVLTDFVKALND